MSKKRIPRSANAADSETDKTADFFAPAAHRYTATAADAAETHGDRNASPATAYEASARMSDGEFAARAADCSSSSKSTSFSGTNAESFVPILWSSPILPRASISLISAIE